MRDGSLVLHMQTRQKCFYVESCACPMARHTVAMLGNGTCDASAQPSDVMAGKRQARRERRELRSIGMEVG